MDNAYRHAMFEQLAEIDEDLRDIAANIAAEGYASRHIYRAAERNLQLLVEACIGIGKQLLKAQGKHVPNEAREVFVKLKSLGLEVDNVPWNKVIGMRNALVHDYLNFDRELVVEVITAGHYLALLEFAEKALQA